MNGVFSLFGPTVLVVQKRQQNDDVKLHHSVITLRHITTYHDVIYVRYHGNLMV